MKPINPKTGKANKITTICMYDNEFIDLIDCKSFDGDTGSLSGYVRKILNEYIKKRRGV